MELFETSEATDNNSRGDKKNPLLDPVLREGIQVQKLKSPNELKLLPNFIRRMKNNLQEACFSEASQKFVRRVRRDTLTLTAKASNVYIDKLVWAQEAAGSFDEYNGLANILQNVADTVISLFVMYPAWEYLHAETLTVGLIQGFNVMLGYHRALIPSVSQLQEAAKEHHENLVRVNPTIKWNFIDIVQQFSEHFFCRFMCMVKLPMDPPGKDAVLPCRSSKCETFNHCTGRFEDSIGEDKFSLRALAERITRDNKKQVLVHRLAELRVGFPESVYRRMEETRVEMQFAHKMWDERAKALRKIKADRALRPTLIKTETKRLENRMLEKMMNVALIQNRNLAKTTKNFYLGLEDIFSRQPEYADKCESLKAEAKAYYDSLDDTGRLPDFPPGPAELSSLRERYGDSGDRCLTLAKLWSTRLIREFSYCKMPPPCENPCANPHVPRTSSQTSAGDTADDKEGAVAFVDEAIRIANDFADIFFLKSYHKFFGEVIGEEEDEDDEELSVAQEQVNEEAGDNAEKPKKDEKDVRYATASSQHKQLFLFGPLLAAGVMKAVSKKRSFPFEVPQGLETTVSHYLDARRAEVHPEAEKIKYTAIDMLAEWVELYLTKTDLENDAGKNLSPEEEAEQLLLQKQLLIKIYQLMDLIKIEKTRIVNEGPQEDQKREEWYQEQVFLDMKMAMCEARKKELWEIFGAEIESGADSMLDEYEQKVTDEIEEAIIARQPEITRRAPQSDTPKTAPLSDSIRKAPLSDSTPARKAPLSDSTPARKAPLSDSTPARKAPQSDSIKNAPQPDSAMKAPQPDMTMRPPAVEKSGVFTPVQSVKNSPKPSAKKVSQSGEKTTPPRSSLKKDKPPMKVPQINITTT